MKKFLLILALAAGIGTAAAQNGEEKRVDKGDTIVVGHIPTFQGKGYNSFTPWVNARLIYPPEALKKGVQGKVMVRFIVRTDGRPTNIEVVSATDESLNREAIRAVRSSPKWEPGSQGLQLKDGTVIKPEEAVPVRIEVPVEFILSSGNRFVDRAMNIPEHGLNYKPKSRETVLNYEDMPIKPTFMDGGLSKYAEWLAANVKLPAGMEAFTTNVELTISSKGMITDERVPRTVDKAARAAIIEGVHSSPVWKPGGVAPHLPAAVRVVVPVTFR